jgi:hypothetical protein
VAGDNVAEPSTASRRDFTRGRIDAIVSRVPSTDEVELQRLRNVRDAAARTLAALEAELAETTDRELLTSRLFAVGQHMTSSRRCSSSRVTTLVTRISHSGSTIDAGLGKLMANQCCLQLREFWRLVDCDLTTEDWDALVRQRCASGRNPFLRH